MLFSRQSFGCQEESRLVSTARLKENLAIFLRLEDPIRYSERKQLQAGQNEEGGAKRIGEAVTFVVDEVVGAEVRSRRRGNL